jgi:hypothetical protein
MKDYIQEIVACTIVLAAVAVAFVCEGSTGVQKTLRDIAGE